MSSAACPRCAEPVRLPAGDATVMVRCPWCHETFELGEVQKSLPPMLEIVSDESAGDSFEAPLIFDEEAGGYSASAEPSAADAFPADAFDQTTVRSSPRRSTRTSPIVGVLKIIGGGIAGIAIALAILQYFDRVPDLGFWPFRGPTAERGGGSSRLPFQPRPERTSPAPSESATPRADTGAGANTNDSPENNDTGETPAELPLPDFGDDVAPTALAQHIERAEQAVADYRALANGENGESGDGVAADRLRELSDALAAIGETLAEANGDAEEERRRIDALVQSLSSDHRLLKDLLQSATTRAEAADSDTGEGLFFVGQLSADGSEYHLKKSARDPRPLRMLVDEESAVDVPAEGSIVIALGTVGREGEETAIRAQYVGSLVQRK